MRRMRIGLDIIRLYIVGKKLSRKSIAVFTFWATHRAQARCRAIKLATATRAEVSDLSWRTKIRPSLRWQFLKMIIYFRHKTHSSASLRLSFTCHFYGLLQGSKDGNHVSKPRMGERDLVLKWQCHLRGYLFNPCRSNRVGLYFNIFN